MSLELLVNRWSFWVLQFEINSWCYYYTFLYEVVKSVIKFIKIMSQFRSFCRVTLAIVYDKGSSLKLAKTFISNSLLFSKVYTNGYQKNVASEYL